MHTRIEISERFLACQGVLAVRLGHPRRGRYDGHALRIHLQRGRARAEPVDECAHTNRAHLTFDPTRFIYAGITQVLQEELEERVDPSDDGINDRAGGCLCKRGLWGRTTTARK